MIAAVLVYVARYPPERTFRAAARLQGTAIAIALAGAIIECASVVHSASRGQGLTLRTDVVVVLGVVGEVRARERSIGALALVPDRNVRLDAVIDEPTEQSACAVGAIGSQVLRD